MKKIFKKKKKIGKKTPFMVKPDKTVGWTRTSKLFFFCLSVLFILFSYRIQKTFSFFLFINFFHFYFSDVSPTGQPNVLFIVSDDLRPTLGSYGEPVLTPNLDQLAMQSIRFTNAHVQVSGFFFFFFFCFCSCFLCTSCNVFVFQEQ